VTTDLEKRAIEQHWAASEAGDVTLEHRLYAEDAILDYPHAGERFVGRSTIAEQRSDNPAHRRFRLRTDPFEAPAARARLAPQIEPGS